MVSRIETKQRDCLTSAAACCVGIGPIDAASPEAARAIAVRYLGPEEGAQFAEQNLGPDSVVIRMRPERWLSTDYSKQ